MEKKFERKISLYLIIYFMLRSLLICFQCRLKLLSNIFNRNNGISLFIRERNTLIGHTEEVSHLHKFYFVYFNLTGNIRIYVISSAYITKSLSLRKNY